MHKTVLFPLILCIVSASAQVPTSDKTKIPTQSRIGTESSEFRSKVSTFPGAATDSTKASAQSHFEPQRNQDRGDKKLDSSGKGFPDPLAIVIGVAAFVQAISAAVQVGVMMKSNASMKASNETSRENLELARSALEETKKSANESFAVSEMHAKAARDAAEVSRLVGIASQRAYVTYNQVTNWSHPDVEGTVNWRIIIPWQNIGRTPTKNFRMSVAYDLRDDEWANDHLLEFLDQHEVGSFIPPLGVKEQMFEFSGEDLFLVGTGHKHLYIWGRCVYNDVFTDEPEHLTRFCVKASAMTGDPRYKYGAENQVAIRWEEISRFVTMN